MADRKSTCMLEPFEPPKRMQHRSNQQEGPPSRAPARAPALPSEWTRLLAASPDGPEGRQDAPTLVFLLEMLQDDPPLPRIEVAPLLLETVAKGRLGRAVP